MKPCTSADANGWRSWWRRRQSVVISVGYVCATLVFGLIDASARELHHLGVEQSNALRTGLVAACALTFVVYRKAPALPMFAAVAAHAATGAFFPLYPAVFNAAQRLRLGNPLILLGGLAFIATQVVQPTEYGVHPLWLVVQSSNFLLPAAAGLVVRQSRRANASLALLRAREEEADRLSPVVELKDRQDSLRRGLHDTIGHGLSAIVMRCVVAKDAPEQADLATTVDLIERDARGALEYLRDILRDIETANPFDDAPDELAGRMKQLVESMGTLGVTVTLVPPLTLDPPLRFNVGGRAGELMYSAGHEALTNVIRHAPGAEVTVSLDELPDGWLLVIRNSPAVYRYVPALPSSGAGLPLLRRRVEAAGGSVSAKPLSDGGYEMRVFVPYPG
jgi:signal transduction histidine kinase